MEQAKPENSLAHNKFSNPSLPPKKSQPYKSKQNYFLRYVNDYLHYPKKGLKKNIQNGVTFTLI